MGQARVRSPAQRTLQRQAESGGFNLADLGHTLECTVWGEIRLTFCFSLSARLGLRSTVLNKMAPRLGQSGTYRAYPPHGLGRLSRTAPVGPVHLPG